MDACTLSVLMPHPQMDVLVKGVVVVTDQEVGGIPQMPLLGSKGVGSRRDAIGDGRLGLTLQGWV